MVLSVIVLFLVAGSNPVGSDLDITRRLTGDEDMIVVLEVK